VSEPQYDALSVIAGSDLEETYYVWDNETGTWVDWDDGTYEAEMEIRDRNAKRVARIANFGTRDGEAELLSEGRLKINLPGAFTADMPITRKYTNSTDPRIVAFRHRGTLFFDLIVTETTGVDDISDLVQGTFIVHLPVTA